MNATSWLSSLTPSPGWLFLIVGIIALVESLAVIGLAVPGVVLITAAASLAGHHHLSLPLLLGSALVGAILGDGASFLLGYTQRERIPALWPFARHPEWLARGARFFQRYGVFSVLIGRFVGPVRPIVPLIAGMMHMPPMTFLWSNLGSALLWSPAYVLPGYLLGRTWQRLLTLPADSERWLIALGVTLVVLALIFSLARHQLARGGHLYHRFARYAQRHPRLKGVWNALSSSQPGGEFPLASLVLLITSLPALSGWTLWVLDRNGPLPMDRQLQEMLAAISHPALHQTAIWLAKAGDTLGVITLILPWTLWLLSRRQHAVTLHLLGGLGGIALANTLFKHLAGRVRPNIPDYLTGSFSYPSAHTSTSVVLYGLLAAFVAEALASRYRALVYWLAIVVCVIMALSRLVLGVHWLSDLIGGALLGLVACALVRISYHRFAIRPPAPTPWLWLGAASLLLLAVRVLWLPPV